MNRILLGMSIVLAATLVYFGVRYDMAVNEVRELRSQVDTLELQLEIANHNLGVCKENEVAITQAAKECMQNMAKERAKTTTAPLRNRQPVSGAL